MHVWLYTVVYNSQSFSYRELARADVNCVVAPVPGANYDDNTAWAIAKVTNFQLLLSLLLKN